MAIVDSLETNAGPGPEKHCFEYCGKRADLIREAPGHLHSPADANRHQMLYCVSFSIVRLEAMVSKAVPISAPSASK